MKLLKLSKIIHDTNKSKGFHDNWNSEPEQIIIKLALIMSEASEALECVRDGDMDLRFDEQKGGKPEGFPSELADIIIRTIDLATLTGVDLKEAIKTKINYNQKRPYNNGKKVKIER